MAVKLIGTDTAGDTNAPTGYVQAQQFTCDATGDLTHIYVYCLVNSNVRVAIYSDDGGDSVGNLIAESDSTAVTATDWRAVAVAGGTINSGTKYWLACQVETAGGCAYRLASEDREYKAQAYGAFPADGTGFSVLDNIEVSLQGWGDTALIISSAGAIASAEAFGTANVGRQTLLPGGIASLEALGSPQLNFTILPSGIATAEVFGTVNLLYDQTLLPDAIASSEAFGTTKLILFLLPSGIATAEALGTPEVNFILAVTGIASLEAFGTASVGWLLRPTIKAIGSGDVSVDDTVLNDYFHLSKFTAEFTGDVERILIYSEGTIDVKVGMYDDNAGEPNNLLNAVNTAITITTGWNEIVFPATAVVLGTDYWLGFNSG